jgi:hypothetical protein
MEEGHINLFFTKQFDVGLHVGEKMRKFYFSKHSDASFGVNGRKTICICKDHN